MASDALRAQLAALLRETGSAHHRAFSATGGDDPDWPLWYADYLLERFRELLGTTLTQRELADLLVAADKAHAANAPGSDWPGYYAAFLLERLAVPPSP